MVRRENRQSRVDDITQDRVVGIARAGQGAEHDEDTTGWWTERGRAERRAWQEGKTEWKTGVRVGSDMSGEGKAGHSAGAEAHSAQGRVVAGAGAVAVAGAGA